MLAELAAANAAYATISKFLADGKEISDALAPLKKMVGSEEELEELLNAEIFYSFREVQIIIEEWRKHYNTKRPHSALGYRPPAPETIIPMDQRPIMH